MEKKRTATEELAHAQRALLRIEEERNKAQKHSAALLKQLKAEQATAAHLRYELDKMQLSRSWRLTAPLRRVFEFGRRVTEPQPRCGLFSRLFMMTTLLPVLPRYYGGLKPACTALRRGKAAFGEVLDCGHLLWKGTAAKGIVDTTCRVLLAFALRIRRNGGVLQALRVTRQTLRSHGRSGLLMLSEPVEVSQAPRPEWSLKDALALLARNADDDAVASCPAVTVVVPVYNGLAHLERLCPALFAHSSPSARFVFVDDGSPDPAVAAFLEQHVAPRPDCVLLRNEQNLGFVKTVNRGMEEVHTPYAVWLNSDVVVPQGWLERLLAPFERNAQIASTTPFTNSAVYFSYPVMGTDNPIPAGTTPEELDRAFARLSPEITDRCTIHSGVGFCMGVNMACWKTIGPLDAEAFDRGYGEECDWCMRAISRGWRNVLAPNLFVYHAHGGSFASEEKMALIEAHIKILWARWPAQMASVAEHERLNPWEPYRALASLLLANHDGPVDQTGEKPGRTVLMVDLNLDSGGACAYREKVIADCEAEGDRILLVQYTREDCRWTLKTRYLGLETQIGLDAPEDLRELFALVPLGEIFINNLAGCEDTERMLALLADLKGPGMRMVYAFHDFYSVCPSYFLLDDQVRFCGGGNDWKCLDCLFDNPNVALVRASSANWRTNWIAFLNRCDELRFFSETTRTIAARIYPGVARGVVIEHAPLKPFDTTYTLPDKDAPLIVGFLGPFVPPKGSDILKEMGRMLEARKTGAHVVTFGSHFGLPDIDGMRHTGLYNRDDLPELLTRNGVKAVVLPSLCAETFSYTSQECVLLEVPFVCFDIGAPAERIRKYGYPRCAIASEFTAQSMLDTVETLLDTVYRNGAE